jgi:hypothetical protein
MFDDEVVIERNVASSDEWGAEMPPDWQSHLVVECALWWWKGSKSTDKSPSNQYARPEATYDETGGDIALPAGTDVTTLDRIGAVTDLETGEVIEEGPFRIVSVNRYKDHVELSLERP